MSDAFTDTAALDGPADEDRGVTLSDSAPNVPGSMKASRAPIRSAVRRSVRHSTQPATDGRGIAAGPAALSGPD
jgi:hypothetical protein